MLDQLERLAFTHRVWAAGGWILTLIAGAVGVAGRYAFSRQAVTVERGHDSNGQLHSQESVAGQRAE